MRIRIATAFAAAVTLVLLAPFASGAATNDPYYGNQWGLQKIRAEAAWAKSTGKGILIAVVDTGVDMSHEDLAVADKLVAGYDFLDDDSDPQDQNGHGTHVAGIAAAATGNRIGVAGVAPDARILVVRVLDAFGTNVNITNPQKIFADTTEGVVWAVNNGAQVINMSFGSVAGSGPDSDLANAIADAWSKGVICVIAAGNDDGDSSGYTTENAVIVAATDSSDRLASYSNIVDEAKWGISAPGSSVYSTYYGYPLNQGHDQYRYLSGTSMAAPHVSGALAVLRSMGLTPQQAVDRLLATAKDLGPPGRDKTFGAGRLDLAAAVGSPTNVPSGGSAGGSSVGGGSSGGTGSGGGKGSPTTAPKATGGATGTSPNPTGGLGVPTTGESNGDVSDEGGKGSGSNLLINLVIGGFLVAAIAGAFVWGRIRGSRSSG